MAGILRGVRGDGTQVNRDLNDFLVGQQIERVEMGAMTAEGYSVARLVLVGGDQVLIIPQMVEPAVTERSGLVAAIRFVFHPRRPRRIVIPGQFAD